MLREWIDLLSVRWTELEEYLTWRGPSEFVCGIFPLLIRLTGCLHYVTLLISNLIYTVQLILDGAEMRVWG